MNRHPAWYAILCYLAVPLSGVGIDIYTPSLPALTHAFHTSSTMIQYSISVYALAFGLSQCIAGPLTDRIGRKKVLLTCLILYVLLSLLSTTVTHPSELLILRTLQGLVGAGISVPARTILADIYDKPTYKRKVSYMMFAWGLGPILAPWIGSHLQASIGWQGSFFFLAAYSIMLIIITLCTHETRPQSHGKKQPLFAGYKGILKNKEFLPATFFLGAVCTVLVLYGLLAPFIIESKLHLSVLVFGRTALLMGVAWALGSLANRFMQTVDLRLKVLVSTIIASIACLFLVFPGILALSTLHALVVSSFITVFCSSVVFTAITAHTLAKFQHVAGSINSILFAVVWGVSGIMTLLVSRLAGHDLISVGISFLCLIVSGYLYFSLSTRRWAEAS